MLLSIWVGKEIFKKEVLVECFFCVILINVLVVYSFSKRNELEIGVGEEKDLIEIENLV